MLPTLRNQKRTLRKSLTNVLRTLDPAVVKEQSSAVTAQVLSLPAFQRCKTVSCYLSMPSGELDTSELITNILASGNKMLFVPKITSNGMMDFLKIYNKEDLNSLPPGGLWGIKEPSSEWEAKARLNALDVGLDVILVPGVAFDRSLSRLGHGKGYYDKYITAYTSSGRPRPLLVALALRDQLVESLIPVDEHDCKMDMVVTPDEIVIIE